MGGELLREGVRYVSPSEWHQIHQMRGIMAGCVSKGAGVKCTRVFKRAVGLLRGRTWYSAWYTHVAHARCVWRQPVICCGHVTHALLLLDCVTPNLVKTLAPETIDQSIGVFWGAPLLRQTDQSDSSSFIKLLVHHDNEGL